MHYAPQPTTRLSLTAIPRTQINNGSFVFFVAYKFN